MRFSFKAVNLLRNNSKREKERLCLESEEPEFKDGNSRLLESGDYKDFAIWLT